MSATARFAIRRHVLLLPVLLASCAAPSALEVLGADGSGIVLSYTADRAAAAERQASLYCANLGRSVRVRETHEASDRVIATFECWR